MTGNLRREGVTYALHHIGIPAAEPRPGERYAPSVGMYTTDELGGPVPVQWHRYDPDSPLHPLLREQPHVAYKVNDLAAAIAGHTLLLGPYEPINGYHVAVIDNAGMPIEFIETDLTNDEIWGRARAGRSASLYETVDKISAQDCFSA